MGPGCLATVISTLLDYARPAFANPWLWVPTVVGIFATAVAIGLGLLDRPQRSDIATFALATVS